MRISVLDPGLESASGHHMALLEHFISHLGSTTVVDYHCACSFEICDTTITENSSNVTLLQSFKSGFYQNYNKDVNYTGANQYVLSLAKEYFLILTKLGNFSNKIDILLPTLLWEHALAFDQALQRFKQLALDVEVNIVALLMFNPIGFESIGNGRLVLNFTMAFKSLGTTSGNSILCR